MCTLFREQCCKYKNWRGIALYPVLLTPAFVACSTNTGKAWVTCSDVPGRVEVWHITSVQAVEWLSESKKSRQDCLMSNAQLLYSLCLQSVVHSLAAFPWLCHSSTRPGTSLHMTQFYQAFPRISTASDKHWVRRWPGYEARHGTLFVHCKLHYPSYKSRDMFVTQVACLSLPVYIHCHAQLWQ